MSKKGEVQRMVGKQVTGSAAGRITLTAEPVVKQAASLGEGAIWNQRDSVLHWVDIDNFLIHTFDPARGADTTINVGAHAGTVVRRADEKGGGFVAAVGNTIAHVTPQGQITVLAQTGEPAQNRLNDGKCDPMGRFWCGSMALDFAHEAGNLYMLDTDKKLHQKLGKVTISNGLVWTSDAKLMYYIDTPTGRLDVFDFDCDSGAIGNRRTAVENTWGGYFDGMTIDKDDNVYIAIWEGGQVLKIDPRTGQLIYVIELPGAKNVTSCAFGGKDFQDLYITTSGAGADREELPNAGNLFKVRIDDSQGLPAYVYAG